jgi:chromosomal replication initiation ATPase DnaA
MEGAMAIEPVVNHTDRPFPFIFPSPLISTQSDPVVANLIAALKAAMDSPSMEVLARSTLKRIRQIQGSAALTGIIEQVASACRVSVEDLASHKRTQRIAFCRQVAFYICRTVSGASYPVIAGILNHEHSAVIHGCRLIERRMVRDAGFRSFIIKLESQAQLDRAVPATAAAAA